MNLVIYSLLTHFSAISADQATIFLLLHVPICMETGNLKHIQIMCSQNCPMLSQNDQRIDKCCPAFISCLKDFSVFRAQDTLDYRLCSVLSRSKCFPVWESCILYSSSCKALTFIATDIFVGNRCHLKFYHWEILYLYLYLFPSVYSLFSFIVSKNSLHIILMMVICNHVRVISFNGDATFKETHS